MSKLVRFGVSLDEDLLRQFDEQCDRRGYQARSEALRDLIRKSLIEQEWDDSEREVAGSLSLVFDHHSGSLAQRLTSVQHDYHHHIISSMHVHLDHDNCLEVLALKGPAQVLRKLSDQLISIKGVKHGSLNLTTTGQNLS